MTVFKFKQLIIKSDNLRAQFYYNQQSNFKSLIFASFAILPYLSTSEHKNQLMKEYYKSLLNSIQKQKQKQHTELTDQLQNFILNLDNRFNGVQSYLNQTAKDLINTKRLQKQTMSQLSLKKSQIKNSSKWNQIKRQTIILQEEDIEEQTKLNNAYKKSLKLQESKNIQLQDRINQQIQKYKKSTKAKKQNITKKRSKSLQNQFSKKISIDSARSQLIFSVRSFEGKCFDFILSFNDQLEKYLLKNPRKIFKGNDKTAVRDFSTHWNRGIFYQDLKFLVKKYVDNYED